MRRLLASLLLMLGGCSAPTAPAPLTLPEALARWSSHDLVTYAFTYRSEGFFTTLDRHTWRVTVRGGEVVAAVDLATGVALAEPAVSSLQSIDGIFAWMERIAGAGSLRDAVFDAALSYPTSFRAAGLPDASGVVTIRDVVALP